MVGKMMAVCAALAGAAHGGDLFVDTWERAAVDVPAGGSVTHDRVFLGSESALEKFGGGVWRVGAEAFVSSEAAGTTAAITVNEGALCLTAGKRIMVK